MLHFYTITPTKSQQRIYYENKQKDYTLQELLYTLLILALAAGWIWNIVKIVHSDFGHITGMLVARVIGVFVAPLGSILGFF